MKFIDKFTGKDVYKAAQRKLKYNEGRYNNKLEKFERETKDINEKIYETITKINEHKKYIHEDLFSRLVDLLSKLKDIDIPEEFTEEKYKKQTNEIDFRLKVKAKDELFPIDFDKDKFVTTIQAIFTFGIYTRRQANIAKENVDNQIIAIKEEMRKMDADLEKYKVCLESLENIEHYFSEMINLMDNWLRYLEHSVNYIGYVGMRIYKKLSKKSISIRFLHEKQQKELEATINLAKTLSELIKKEIVVDKDGQDLSDYANEMANACAKYNNTENNRI